MGKLEKMPSIQAYESVDVEMKSESPAPQYQYDIEKINSYGDGTKEVIMQLIKLLNSGDWESRNIIRNTLNSYGVIVTKREGALNKVLG